MTRYRSRRIAPGRNHASLPGVTARPSYATAAKTVAAAARKRTAQTTQPPEGKDWCKACHQPIDVRKDGNLKAHRDPDGPTKGWNQCPGADPTYSNTPRRAA